MTIVYKMYKYEIQVIYCQEDAERVFSYFTLFKMGNKCI